MNEPNKQRMIPLHIADQAVAACNKEIAELQAEIIVLREAAARLYQLFDESETENERLRAAGDAMAARLLYQGYPETVQAWEAAKKL
jgi:hypothetical protein